MSVIDSLRDYIATYSALKTNAPVWVDYLGTDQTEYAVVPLAGTQIVKRYITGKTVREYPFAFQFSELTADNTERVENNEFSESFADWLESQTKAGTLPTMETGKKPTRIEATAWGSLFQQGEKTGTYQINCKLTYEQDA